MQIHEVQRKHPNKKAIQVGRGGKRGKTCGRGTKGQKARAGRKLRPELRDTIKRLPKRRGYGKNRARTINSGKPSYIPVNLSDLETFESGARISPVELVEMRMVRRQNGKLPKVKILARGTLTKKLTIAGCAYSEKAKAAIEAAGGTIS